MKKLHTLLIISFSLFLGNMRLLAQVTIGSDISPNKGALLDLKENDNSGANSTKGLSLPKVQLSTIYSLDDIEPNLDKDEHIGLAIYVPDEFENSCPGIYVWTGTEWEGLNTDAARLPEYTNVTDIDGNTYKAKLFNRKGCTKGTYWFTSNLRTTRFNDGTPVRSTKNYDLTLVTSTHDDEIPMLMADGKSHTAEMPPYNEATNTNYLDPNNTKLRVIKTKSDLSTSTSPDKIIEFYMDGVLQQLTEDQFATKFGLMYILNMAFEGDFKLGTGGTEITERKLCPEGWRIPTSLEWVNLAIEMGASDRTDAINNAAEYLGSPHFYKPIDADTYFAKLNYKEISLHEEFAHPKWGNILGTWILPPKALSEGMVKNADLNIHALGYGRLPYSTPPPAGSNLHGLQDWVAQIYNSGSSAAFLERGNGVIFLSGYRYDALGNPAAQFAGSGGDRRFASVRCIKVVE